MAGGKGKSPREYGRRARSARAAPAAASRGSGQGGGEAPPAPSASAAAGQLMSPADSMAGPDLQSGYFGGGRPRGHSSAAEGGGRGGSFQLGDSQHSLGGTAGEAEPTAEGAPQPAAAGNDSVGGDDDGTLQEAGGAVDGKHPASLGADGRALAVSASALSVATSQSGLSAGLSTPLGGDASPAGQPGSGTATTAEDDLRDVEAARTRRNSADEDILLGRRPKRGSSAASLGGRADGDGGGPGGKRPRGPPADDRNGDAALAGGDSRRPDRPALYARPLDVAPSREYHVSAAGYSVRHNLDVPAPPVLPVTDGSSLSSSGGGDASVESFRTARSDLDEQAPPADEGPRRGHQSQRQMARWRAHRMAEDYVSLASSIVLPPVRVGPYGDVPLLGSYPVEQPTALGYLLSPLRRPTVIENWNPREIALFEASLSVHGKLFHVVSGHVGTKSTKEVVEFYYIWKKTAHYRAWKGRYRPLIMESDVSDDEDGEEGAGGGR